MKKIFTLITALLLTTIIFSQAPVSFKYQAVLRDVRGNIKANTSAGIIISILQGSATGTTVYSETHSITTDGYGLINLEIGKGTVTNGTFSTINWGSGPYFVKVVVDGVEMGTSQLLSVPYALYATKAANGFSGSYIDLTDKPTLFDGAWSSLTGKPSFATVATSGSYTDLKNKPALFDSTYSSLKGKPLLATIATSGSYTDLKNKPALFDSTYSSLKGKPSLAAVATSGSYTDLTNKPALFDSTYSNLKGKPSLATVATSGNYNDLSNKPVISFDTVNHLTVKGKTADMGEALFEVKNKNGQTVFAVYNEGVRIYVDNGAKGTKGGFAIGGFGTAKAPSQNYFVVSSDSIRAYIDPNPSKGTKGGFAIGGFNQVKAANQEYLRVTADSTRLNFNESTTKGTKGGFAIGGFSAVKGGIQDFLTINSNDIRMYINDNPVKGTKGGFAIGGFSGTKAGTQDYLRVTRDSSRIYFNDAPAKGTKGGFAIGGFGNAKAGLTDYLLINQDSSNFYVRSQGNGATSFNINSYDPALGWQSLMTANPDTINMTGVLSLDNNLAVSGNVNYSGTVARDTTPDITTSAVYDITKTTATGGGDIISNGGAAVIVSGICWSTAANPTIANTHTVDGESIGSFISNLTGLTFNTTYHVRAYATNSKGTAYGNDVTFTTSPEIPVLTTIPITAITPTTASSGGNITSNGGASITGRGICWSTTVNPTIADYTTSDSTGTGSFVSHMTGLTENTTYFVRAYATNSAGTAYGNALSFTTTAVVLPTISTTSITSITISSAASGGNITSNGGAPVTTSGICWSTTVNPTTADNSTADGTATGSFISNLTGLTASTTYYVRAYAINSAGTAYGNSVNFITSAALAVPTLTTTIASAITAVSATSGGNISSDGGATVTVRGVCWSTTSNPTTADSKTTDGTGTGSFVSSLTGLTASTIYYVRAYATNSEGTAYGTEINFTTTAAGATVQDIDGNTYNIVTIGTQTWMAENLKTTKYSDGTVIPLVSDGPTWSGLSTPGFCWYNNDAATYQATYGALYNWYALDIISNGGKNVCPTGWHVPFDAEWTTLTDFLGGEAVAGSKLKEVGLTHWLSPNSDATNEQSFTALPGGVRNYLGPFMQLGSIGNYWSLTESSPSNAFFRNLNNNNGNAAKVDNFKKFGMSVRCLQGVATTQVPSVLTSPVSSITQISAISGGNVVNDGGAAVTVRGVCWSTTPGPTIVNSKTADGSGNGIFPSNITGLTSNTTYYVRSYATNSVGTAYGNEQTFTTIAK
jgi:uncharacterized protein (TIGR02145 family)